MRWWITGDDLHMGGLASGNAASCPKAISRLGTACQFTNTNIAGTRSLPGTSLQASSGLKEGFNVGPLPLRVSLGRSRSPAQSPSIPVPI